MNGLSKTSNLKFSRTERGLSSPQQREGAEDHRISRNCGTSSVAADWKVDWKVRAPSFEGFRFTSALAVCAEDDILRA